MDVIQRLEPVIIEVERERECVCIVAHQAVLRALYAYFMHIPLKVGDWLSFGGGQGGGGVGGFWSWVCARHPGCLRVVGEG